MARKINPQDFLLNTDYEMDKIIYFKSGSLEAGQSQNISHNLGFIPLIFGVCAFNQDFSDPRSLPFEQITQSDTISFSLGATNNYVQIGYGNYDTNPPKMYYRIYAFEPSNSRAKIGPTSKHANLFILNTDYNYCKLFKSGIVNGAGTHTIDHNLGYIPQVLAWGERNGFVIPFYVGTPYDPALNQPQYIAVSNSNITIKVPSNSFDKVHYRIYYDEV